MRPELFDRSALTRFRQRTSPEALFLHMRAFDQIKERLSEVNRAFKNVAVVTGHPDFWANMFPAAKVLADEDVLDLDHGAFDLILHVMALHAANDPVGQMIQCRHALEPDGLFLSVCFGGQTLSELRVALSEAEVELRGGLSPRIVPMADLRDLGALLQRAGFALPVADFDGVSVSYSGFFNLLSDVRQMGEANALNTRVKHFTPRRLFERAAEIYKSEFGQDGRLPATFEMVYLTGWAPSDTQQKPLRPGSAKARLAEALSVQELSAGEPVDATLRKSDDTSD